MGQLLFKKCFWPMITSGAKRTTIRRWLRPRVKAGERAYSPGVGWLRIDAIDVVDLNRLTETDARADGFNSPAALRRALAALYPATARDGRTWFRITFHITTRASI